MSKDSAKAILDDLQPLSSPGVCERLADKKVACNVRETLGRLAEAGEFDLFSKLMEMIPPQCAKKVFPDPKDGVDYMRKAADCNVGERREAPIEFYQLILRTVPGIHEYQYVDYPDCDDSSERTLLHIACGCYGDKGKLPGILRYNRLFSDVLAVRLPDDKLRLGDIGETPLHLAVQQRNFTTSQLEEIIKMYPAMLKMEVEPYYISFPLQHMIYAYSGDDKSERLQLLLKAYPQSAKIEGYEGADSDHKCIPLNTLVQWHRDAPLSDYRMLLEAYPRGGVHMTYSFSESAIYIIWHDWINNIKKCPPPKFSVTKWLSPPKEICLEGLEEVWSRIELMLLAATTGSTSKSFMLSSPSDRRWNAIDAIVDCSAACPWDMFLLAIAKHFGHPEKRDADGRLPLHVIARASLYWSRQTGEEEEHKDLKGATPLQAILQASPSAAREVDFNGELPLHIAAKTPDYQSDQDLLWASNIEKLVATYKEGAAHVDGKGRLPLHHAILARKWFDPDLECLLDAAPLTTGKADPITRLLPFMLAAVENNASLDSVYLLLQRDPMAVSSGVIVKEGEVEKYWLNKTANLASENASLKARIAELEGNGGSNVTRSRKRKMTQRS